MSVKEGDTVMLESEQWEGEWEEVISRGGQSQRYMLCI